MSTFSKYTIRTKNSEIETVFSPDIDLINKLPISTPFTFAIYKDMVVLAFDKNNWWNPLGGHIENGETWQEALIREAEEEAGVVISEVKHIGNIIATHKSGIKSAKYPEISILPITVSKVVAIKDWKSLETSQRGLYDGLGAEFVLSLRDDNEQMLQIFREYVAQLVPFRNKHTSDSQSYDWVGENVSSKIPFSQVYGYCYTKDKKIILVRDFDEKHFSLPGGTPEKSELPEQAYKRELLEEAQVTASSIDLMGSVLVTENFTGLPKIYQQVRYISFIETLEDFIPQKDGMEIIERRLVSLDELPDYIPWLKFPVGIEQYRLLRARLESL